MSWTREPLLSITRAKLGGLRVIESLLLSEWQLLQLQIVFMVLGKVSTANNVSGVWKNTIIKGKLYFLMRKPFALQNLQVDGPFLFGALIGPTACALPSSPHLPPPSYPLLLIPKPIGLPALPIIIGFCILLLDLCPRRLDYKGSICASLCIASATTAHGARFVHFLGSVGEHIGLSHVPERGHVLSSPSDRSYCAPLLAIQVRKHCRVGFLQCLSDPSNQSRTALSSRHLWCARDL